MKEYFDKRLSRVRPHLLPVFLLVLAVVAVYWQSLGYDFLRNWDDNHYILENADVQGFGWDRVQAVFTKYYVGNYAPVQMLSYMLDYWLWGFHASGYHFVNLAIHAVNGLLVYRLFAVLTNDRLAAFCGAAIFLLHPVQVETVAWISQRKNLLALFFFLLAWDCYRSYCAEKKNAAQAYYVASLLFLMLALLSKSVAVIFPVAILLFDLCYGRDGGNAGKRQFLDKIPFLVVAVIAAALAVHSQAPDNVDGSGGGRTGYHGGSPFATLLTMLPVLCSYFRLILLPTNLSALYDPVIRQTPDIAVIAAMLFLAVTAYLIFRLYQYKKSMAFWPAFFFLALLPVLQIVPLVTLINDRYLYFPIIGIAGLAACAMSLTSARRLMAGCFILLLLPAMSFLTVKRLHFWRNGVALWSDTVQKSPKVALAWEALGEALHYNQRPDRMAAEKAYLRVLALNPDIEISRYNLALLYLDMNELPKAEAVLNELLRRKPDHVMGLSAFGDLAIKRYDYVAAERYYRKANALQPDAVPVLQKLANLMVVFNRFAEAKDYCLEIDRLQWESDYFNAYELARISSLQGDTGTAIHWLEIAIRRGFREYDRLMADEELMPVMADARFSELMVKYFPSRTH